MFEAKKIPHRGRVDEGHITVSDGAGLNLQEKDYLILASCSCASTQE